MPALIAHYLFGVDALKAPELARLRDATSAPAARAAFLLGCQGPDPFFFAATTTRAPFLHSLARRMHRDHTGRTFELLRSAAARFVPADGGQRPPAGDPSRLLQAFACGMLAHYALDRCAHPYVYAMEDALCRSTPDLADAHHEVHALIESDIDVVMTAGKSGDGSVARRAVHAVFCDIDEVRAAKVALGDASAPATLAIGHAVAAVASQAYGLQAGPDDWAGALDDMRRCYRVIELADAGGSRAVGAVERRVRPHSILQALAHSGGPEAIRSMNLDHRRWSDPHSGISSSESFIDVYERSLAWYREAANSYLDGVPCIDIAAGVNHYGRSAK